ncbi:adhesion G-protein coupled receptor G1-like isoform X2 [Puntigrus tetrazona]|uniref:adhesion G-protein coupled receptor G1-like isoform X2 n=1 Tax=Puntigrus tetrazona TaxID=1606681 RepID=UPI001C8A0BED|nr:adhesion G-protein coupled receptor G1-like isoform X2 [Puntigrus tetrazona]
MHIIRCQSTPFMKQTPKTLKMWIITCLLFTLVLAMENDRNFKMCGTWRHGNAHQNLSYNLKTGCESIEISANESTLSIQGRITAKCTKSSSVLLQSNPLQNQSQFCVFWEPLLDLLIVEVNGKNYTLCESLGLQGTCCTDLSQSSQETPGVYGIVNGSIHGDIIRYDVREKYIFRGDTINCKEKFCDVASQKPSGANMIEEVVMKSKKIGRVELPCAQSTTIEIKEGFTGLNFTLPVSRTVSPNMIPSIYLPSSLKSKSRSTSKVVCTYYTDNTLFQRASSDAVVLDGIVGLSVENEIIKNLPEPVRIRFHHSALPTNYSRRCVSWDIRKDNEVNWRYDDCETVKIHDTETECCCYRLTYFAILAQVEQKATARHLKALTFITAVGCAVSLVSCLVLFYWLCKRRKERDQSLLVRRGLVLATILLCLCFSLTGALGNAGNETVCRITGTLLHYSLLSTLCWMTVEMFHTFFVVVSVSSSNLPSWVFYLAGFALVVCRLLSIGDIYGLRKTPSEGVASQYFMCWILDSDKIRLAHYIVIIGLTAVVVSSGAVMLLFVATKIRNQLEWRKNRMAFFSIWGLTCLSGTSWGLCLFNFGSFSEAVFFLFCTINSCLGAFHVLRYYVLEQMKKRCELNSDGDRRGSVMLQCTDDESIL